MSDWQFVARRTEYNRNVVRVRVPPGANDSEVLEYAKKVGADSAPFGYEMRRYGEEVEVAFYTD